LKLKSKKSRAYGFSQGRLSTPPGDQLQWFPQEKWRTEFFNAGNLGCSFIELLIERERNPLNPIWSDKGRSEIKKLCIANNLTPYSIVLDYIIDNSILDPANQKAVASIYESISVASKLNCHIIVLPLMEESALTKDNFLAISKVIREAGIVADKLNIMLCIETLLPAEDVNEFINIVGLKSLKAVFDTGNRASENIDLKGQIIKMGNNIGHVHIKDKDRFGNNVVLGSGLVNFCRVFEALDEISYDGCLNFETNRGTVPLDTARFNIALCDFFARNAKNSVN